MPRKREPTARPRPSELASAPACARRHADDDSSERSVKAIAFLFGAGLSLFLLAGLPAALGLTVLAPARGALDREARTTQVAIVLGIAMLGLAFARSTKF